jgi:type III pantothenate kinase
MLAAFDVGNTAVKLALFEGETLVARWRFATDPEQQAVDYWSRFRSVLVAAEIDPAGIDRAAIVSVVPDVAPIVADACRQYFRCDPYLVNPDARVPVESRYDAALGSDRLMNVVAALHHYGPGPLVVVDLGTAVKFEAIDAEGVHLGGAISPGIAIATDELFGRVALVARAAVHPPESSVGRDTQSAVDAGVVLGYAGMVTAMVQRFREEIGAPARVIATGGWAPRLEKECPFDVLDGDLTVKGLRLVYELNAPDSSAATG